MKLETFFEKFELFAEAPGAVAKLRELVRHLAVTGRLVAQDIREGSGELLLRRVDAERLAAVKAHLISPMKPLPAVSENELPFKLQHGWAAARLIELVMEIKTGPFGSSLHKSDYLLGGTPVINPASLKDGKIIPIDEMAISHETVKRLEVFKLCAGDIILARRGEMGRCAVVTKNEEGWLCGTGSLSLRMPHSTYAPYLAMLIGSPICRAYLGNASVGTTMQNLNQSILANMPVGIPPLAEQKRIVAKLDELMALCDELEAQQQEREAQRAKLARASLARFEEAPTSTNLAFLFYPSYNISPIDLRRSILALAVRGKLIPEIKTVKVSLGDVIELISGQHLLADEQNNDGKGIPYLTGPSDFGPHHPNPSRWTETPRVVAEPGDILITVKGSGVGKTNKLIETKTAISRQLMAVRAKGADADFVHLVLMDAANHFQSSMTGIAIPGIGRNDVLKLEAELPPLAEQRRIVARADQLMTLTDQLEAEISASQAAATKLLEAIIAELTTEA
jgi:type I restriction enzyme, S subunit